MVYQERYTLLSGNISWNSVRGKNEYPDYDQTILRRNGKLLEEFCWKDTWTTTSYQSDCHQLLFLPVVKDSVQWMKNSWWCNLPDFFQWLSEHQLKKHYMGNMDEPDEDLLDLFSRLGSHCLPSKDNLRAAILTMAHKALLQEPKFIIDCFLSSIHNAVPTLITKDSIMELNESKRPTNRKVAQMIKPSS